MHTTEFDEIVSMEDGIDLEIVSCEFMPIMYSHGDQIAVRFWNLDTLRQEIVKYDEDEEEEATELYTEKLAEFSIYGSKTFRTTKTIRFILEHDMKYFNKFFRIPLPNPIAYDDEDVCIDPYFLGLWLGDGDSVRQTITTADDEIVDYLKEYAKKLDLTVKVYLGKHGKRCPRYTISSNVKNNNVMLDKLKSLDLIENKHIPEVYLKNSIQKRRELLAGLLDSDGSKESNQTYSFGQLLKRESLIDEIATLAKELGFCTRKEYRDTYCTNTKDGKKLCKSIRLRMIGDFSKIPLKIKRKKFINNPKNKISNVYVWKLTDMNGEDLINCPIDSQRLQTMNEKLERLFKHYVNKKSFSGLESKLGVFYRSLKNKWCGINPTFEQIKESGCSIVKLIKMLKYPNN